MPTALPGRPSPSLRNTFVATVALILSLSLHFGAYEAVRDRVFAPSLGREPEATPTPVTERPTLADLYQEADGESPDPMAQADPLAGEGATAPADLMEKATPASLFEPPPAPALPPPAAALPDPPPAGDAALPPPRELPAPDILAVTDARSRDLSAPIARREIPAIDRLLLAPDLTLSYSAEVGLPPADPAAALVGLPALLRAATADSATRLLPAPIPIEERRRAAAEAVPDVGPVAQGTVAADVLPEPAAQVAPARPLDDRLRLGVAAIRPATDPDHVYFRIDVGPRDSDALPDIPRDIVFVQDTSASLTERRLAPCRQAILDALRSDLGPADRFNLCAFSTTNRFLAPGAWLPATPESIADADAFLSSLRSEGNTDLFRSMHDILSLPRDPDRAPIAIVLTDGHITAGAIARDSAVIGAFSRLNAGAVSVFTVGVDKGANAFLLDMLSFCDRGGNTAITRDRFSIRETIHSVVGSIGQPILANVRFRFDTASNAEVFPALTSNLYRDRPLCLYGRVPANRPSFAFQALGDANGDRYDMLFVVDLEGPSVADGQPSLPTEWATQRMYDLVAEYAHTESPDTVAEMQLLGARFGIPVPHARRLGAD